MQAQTPPDADRDENGLIEIDSLLMLHNMRHDLAGTSYKTSTASVGDASGCPDTGCIGYELTGNLDFDLRWRWKHLVEATVTWSYSSGCRGTARPVIFRWTAMAPAAGCRSVTDQIPLSLSLTATATGSATSPSVASQTHVGLFGVIKIDGGSGAAIRNLGLVDNLADYTGSSDSLIYIGGLVGSQGGGSITASYATGDADGGDGSDDSVGGLVGMQGSGSITASYATGDADGGDGSDDRVGGLVGLQGSGSITASYATGDADGGDGSDDSVGGLVGMQGSGSITASYATGDADGGDGSDDRVGGLVGLQGSGSITASYATGDADGGDGSDDSVGGLVGLQGSGSITASYATGDADGGDGGSDLVGGLVGYQLQGPIAVSYSFGGTIGRGDRGVGWLDKTSRSRHSGSADRSQCRVGLEQCR